MKFTLPKLKVGDRVQAQVIESLSDQEAIINFNGDLSRVYNSTGKELQPGMTVKLEVVALTPLSFRMATLSRRGFQRRV